MVASHFVPRWGRVAKVSRLGAPLFLGLGLGCLNQPHQNTHRGQTLCKTSTCWSFVVEASVFSPKNTREDVLVHFYLDIKSNMQQFVVAIRNSLENQNWHAALFLSLAMPDICAKLEKPESGNAGPRYRNWFDKYLASINKTNIMGHDVTFMTAGDCWALRCSLLHEGSDDVGEQRAMETVSQFRFTTMGVHRIKVGQVLVLNVARFCEEVCQAVEAWSRGVENNPEVQGRINGIVAIEHQSFPLHSGGSIG